MLMPSWSMPLLKQLASEAVQTNQYKPSSTNQAVQTKQYKTSRTKEAAIIQQYISSGMSHSVQPKQ
jgi:hypothetical protein